MSEETLTAETQSSLAVQDWGLVDYNQAFQQQQDLAALVSQELARDTLVFCTHPPVVTLGRGTKPGDVTGWSGQTVEVNRGGRATYHGPSQIVVYPIIDLNPRGRDLHKYFRSLEVAIINTLKEFGVAATGRSPQVQVSDETATAETIEATGVWIGSRKIASIGIGVRKWTTLHGLALNIEKDPTAFQGLRPCGFSPETMISLEEAIAQKPERERVKSVLSRELIAALSI